MAAFDNLSAVAHAVEIFFEEEVFEAQTCG
jgi:hypothetical protein